MNSVVPFRHLVEKFLLRGEQPNVTLNFWYINSDFLRVINYTHPGLYSSPLSFVYKPSPHPLPQHFHNLASSWPASTYKVLHCWLLNLFKWLRTWTLGSSLWHSMLLLLLLSCFSHVRLCATPQTAAHQAPLSLGFSRQDHWSGVPFPSPMHESEKWKWSRSVSVRLFVTPWTAAYQAPPSMGFSRQEYWSGVPLWHSIVMIKQT